MSGENAFPPTANPAAYVPCAGSERALAEIQRWALDTKKPVCVLSGPPGMGKTLLLRMFAARVRDRFEVTSVPHPDCDPDLLCRWVLAALGQEPGEDPRVRLADALPARRPGGAPLLIEIDEADLVPRETLAWLIGFAGSSAGAVRVLLAMTDEAQTGAVSAPLGGEAEVVRLEVLMSQAEIGMYVSRELERAGVDRAIRERFDERALAELHERSRGVPGLVQREAAQTMFRAELERGAPAVLATMPREPFEATAERAPARRDPAPAAPTRTSMPQGPPSLLLAIRRPGFVPGLVLGASVGFALAWGLATWRGAPPAYTLAADLDVAAPASDSDTRTAPLAQGPVVVSVNADPWAEIEVDGRAVGETPIARLALAPGRHRFSARMPDGRVLDREVDVLESGARVVFP
jgi:type II secretory pathway predicted ATPase ExeA